MLARLELPELGASSEWAASFASAYVRVNLVVSQTLTMPGSSCLQYRNDAGVTVEFGENPTLLAVAGNPSAGRLRLGGAVGEGLGPSQVLEKELVLDGYAGTDRVVKIQGGKQRTADRRAVPPPISAEGVRCARGQGLSRHRL